MMQLKEVICELEKLRGELNSLIREETRLIELQIIKTSQKLDALLNIYNELTEKTRV